MPFLYPSLFVLGGVMVILPLLVHLLTRRRRRVVRWPAMDFLIQSYRLNRTRMQLNEFFLLVLRMLAVLLAGLLAGGPIASEALEAWFRSPRALHLVVIDDSYSMGQSSVTGSVWVNATDALMRIASTAAQQSQEGRMVIVRYSDVLAGVPPFESSLTPAGLQRIETWVTTLQPSQSAASPVEALQVAAEIARSADESDEACYAYLLSDLRNRDHSNDPSFIASLGALSDAVNGLVLGPCCNASNSWPPNLTLTSIDLEPGPAAAGIESVLTLRVTNQGDQPTPETLARLHINGREAPAVEIDSIAAGEQLERSVTVHFDRTGPLSIRAELPADSLAADNTRWFAIDVPSRRRLLLVDGSQEGIEGRAFALALRPRQDSPTGWAPKVARTKALESFGDYTNYAAIMLLEPPSLSSQARKELLRFIEQGGGLLVVAGPGVQPKIFNSQLASQESLGLPQLELPTQPQRVEQGLSPIVATNHPVTRVLQGEGKAFLPLVQITMHYAVKPPRSTEEPVQETLVKLSDGTPLMLAANYGRGRIVALLTSVAARGEGDLPWSNFATLPIFPLIANDLTSWLVEPRVKPKQLLVGDPTPGEPNSALQSSATMSDENSIALGSNGLMMQTGVFRSPADQASNAAEIFSVNVNPAEAQLEVSSIAKLKSLAQGIAEVVPAHEIGRRRSEATGASMTHAVGIALLLALVAERLLAYSCSYVSSTFIEEARA